MTESVQQVLSFGKMLGAIVCALLYAMGGMHGTWIRRYVMPAVLAAMIIGISILQGTFTPYLLLFPMILCATLHLGYGADDEQEKITKRFIYGGAVALAALPLAIISGNWITYMVHASLFTAASVLFGVWNPLRSARDEETMLGALSVLLPIFMI